MTELVLYDQACRALAQAKAVDDVKDIKDRADAMRVYARQANNRQMEIDASEIRFRAERRIGELMALQRDTVGLAPAGRPKSGSDETQFKPPALSDMGIGKTLADRARRYADLDQGEFDRLLQARRESIERDRTRITLNLQEVDKAALRTDRETALGAKVRALPEKRYGVILDDPEWRFEVWSRETGLDRAADNHYPTSDIETILARDVTSIAAPDCAWFRWVTVPYLAEGLRSIEVDGFVYKSSWAWSKDRIGTGYWNRNRHEILLLAVRGAVPCPAPGRQFDSLLTAPVGVHSAKPEIFLEMIDAYFPSVPKIELNRRGDARPGWDAWGNEATSAGETGARDAELRAALARHDDSAQPRPNSTLLLDARS